MAVPDSHEAMLTLAAWYRDCLPAKFVAITGSNGKTTTKELTGLLLEAVTSHVFRSPGNLNNLFGVPLATFKIPPETQVAVMELGISTFHEMPRLAQLVRPDVIILTNVGPSHLETLGTVEDVARAKLELVRAAAPEVPVIVNADDRVLMSETARVRTNFVTFGLEADADFKPQSMEPADDGATMVTIEGHPFRLPLPGRHQVMNLTAAFAAVKCLGYSFDNIDTAAIELDTSPMRGQRLVKDGITFIADCYNANPESVRIGLDTFFGIPGDGRRVLILGDMLELGREAAGYHAEAGRRLGQGDFAMAVFVGSLSKETARGAREAGVADDRLHHCDQTADAVDFVKAYLRPGDLVYVKASRGIGLEAVLDAFDNDERAE